MSVLRQANILGQQRFDVPHIRGIESSIAADFDMLAGRVLAGSKALVVSGFTVITAGAIGNPATSLSLNVANGMLLHPLASENGTIFQVAGDAAAEILNNTNPAVEGSFTPGQTNYVGVDLRRSADDSTADLVMFLDANTKLETPKTTPLARTLQYRIVISTTDFSSTLNVLPLAKVVVAGSGNVTSIEDARQMMYRLGTGGSTPNKLNSFPWATGRNEKVQDAALSVFDGADKSISSFKDFADALMTRLWELGGGEFWYSATSDRDVKVVYDAATALVSNGDNFDWVLGSQTLSWAGISVTFANSTGLYNTVLNGSTAGFLDGYCLYVDINRATNGASLTAAMAPMTSLGSPTIPGSRFVLAWRKGIYVYIRDRQYEINRVSLVATTTVVGDVKLSRVASTPGQPIVISDTGGTIQATGTNYGLVSTGGSGGGAGLHGIGGGNLSGISVGVLGEGSPGTLHPGVLGRGGSFGGAGVYGEGGGSGSFVGVGVWGQGGSGGGISAVGLYGIGGASPGGHGVLGHGGGNGSAGVVGIGGDGSTIPPTNTGAGGWFIGDDGSDAAGLYTYGAGVGYGLIAIGRNGTEPVGMDAGGIWAAAGDGSSAPAVMGVGGGAIANTGDFGGQAFLGIGADGSTGAEFRGGVGTTFGIVGHGGSTGGAGVRGVGTAGSGPGLSGLGNSGGAGVDAKGGATGVGGTFAGGDSSANGHGISSIGGNTAGTIGVYGQGGSAGGRGGDFLGILTAEGVRGRGGATGIGGVFQGGATSGIGITGQGGPNSVGISATGGSSAAGGSFTGGSGGAAGATFSSSNMAIDCLSGNVQIVNTANYKTATAVTRYAHGSPMDCVFFNPGQANYANWVSSGWGVAVRGNGWNSYVVTCRIRVPLGATLTGIQLSMSSTSGTTVLVNNINVITQEYSSGDSYTGTNNYALNGGTHTLAITAAQNWFTPTGTWTNRVVKEGFVTLDFQVAATDSTTNYVFFYGARLQYAMIDIVPPT